MGREQSEASLRDSSAHRFPRQVEAWIAWARLLAVPFAFLEVTIERGNYPSGYERWAWITTAAFAVGAVVFFRLRGLGLVAVAFDTAIVSAFVLIYSFELGTPVRQILVLPVIEAALRYGVRGGLLSPLATVPALALFEWLHTDRHGLPFDAGHILGPLGLEILIGLVVGVLVDRLRRAERT